MSLKKQQQCQRTFLPYTSALWQMWRGKRLLSRSRLAALAASATIPATQARSMLRARVVRSSVYNRKVTHSPSANWKLVGACYYFVSFAVPVTAVAGVGCMECLEINSMMLIAPTVICASRWWCISL